jgi:hypothetical protein
MLKRGIALAWILAHVAIVLAILVRNLTPRQAGVDYAQELSAGTPADWKSDLDKSLSILTAECSLFVLEMLLTAG